MANELTSYDDEIDLREIALTLWRGRWPILILTLVAALAAYAVSAWLLPKQYEAVAYVTVGQPTVRYLAGQLGLSAIPSAPDIKALPEVVKANAILKQVESDARVVPLFPSNGKNLARMTQVSAVGVSQLRFEVTDTDPERAATLATVWAEKAAEWIELNYGLGAFKISLDAQIAETQQDYAQAQYTLETFLAQDQTPVLQSQLNAQGEVYACLERRVRAANALLRRLGDLETRLVQSDDPLSLSDALLLVSIQQDIDSLEICGSSGTILQSSSPMLFAGISSTRGLEVIAGYRQSLEQRIANTQVEQETLQEEILASSVEIEQLDYQRTEYTILRDQARTLYQQLTLQRAYMESVLQQSGRVADVSAEAIAPGSASSPKPLVNTAVAGLLGLALGALGVLGVDWWKKVGKSA